MRNYNDVREHLDILEEKSLLVRVERDINKDTEMHPLVRWQFRSTIPESERKGFLFENVIDSKGKHYDFPVAVGILASSPEIYAAGLQCSVDEISEKWEKAMANPIEPITVDSGPVHEVIYRGNELNGEGKGLDMLPVPISTPGFDNAPYTTCSHWFTKDIETGIQNAGNYRGQIKGRGKIGCYNQPGQHFTLHLQKYKEKGHAPPFHYFKGMTEDKVLFKEAAQDSCILINATLKTPFPPISLPKREYMERAEQIWEELGLPRFEKKYPWYGYSLGQWDEELEEEAELAIRGDYYKTGEKLAKNKVKM